MERDFEDLRYFFHERLHSSVASLCGGWAGLSLGQEATVGYLSEMMARFMRSDCVFMPDEVRGEVGSITQRYLTASDKRTVKDIADFTIFVSGLFPEKLKRLNFLGLYEEAGSTCYNRLYVVSEPGYSDVFRRLSDKFGRYRRAITQMRDSALQTRRLNEEGIEVVFGYQDIRGRAVMRDDSQIEWTM